MNHPVLGAALLVAIAVSPAPARADWREDMRFARRVLLPDCLTGYQDACDELTAMIADIGQHEPLPHVRWRFAALAARTCDAGHVPACRLALRFGREMVAEPSPESIDRGTDLLTQVCELHADACPLVRAEGERLLAQAPGAPGVAQGTRLLEAACLRGDVASCSGLTARGLDNPHGSTQRLLGTIFSYAGMGTAVLGGVGWAAAFGDHRCRTRGQDGGGDIVGACFASITAYAAGTAGAALGTKLRLNGEAREQATSAEASGNSWFLWLGIGAGALGAAVPLGVELLDKDWREVIAYSPLAFGVVSQALFFLARFFGPMNDDPYNPQAADGASITVAPAALSAVDGAGRVAALPGALVTF